MIFIRRLRGQPEAVSRENHRHHVHHGLRRITENSCRAGEQIRTHLDHEHDEAHGQRKPHGTRLRLVRRAHKRSASRTDEVLLRSSRQSQGECGRRESALK